MPNTAEYVNVLHAIANARTGAEATVKFIDGRFYVPWKGAINWQEATDCAPCTSVNCVYIQTFPLPLKFTCLCFVLCLILA